ncbi:MAG: outer membrane lipoprotein-sorting protein [Candidatus Krumholzibacteriota bacterium]|nr:outer membrane lipoprotein-sorting protein [Candidatus Krumholzibacteriota bacterium]
MRHALTAAVLLLLACNPAAAADRPTGEEVLARIDENMYVDHAVTRSTMIVHARSGTRTITSRSWRKGKDNSFVEYLSPARERGKKMLRLGDKLWNYAPEPEDRIIAISGHLLRQSVMGSDLSYEDVTENTELVEKYDAAVVGEEEIEGRACWVVEMTAKVPDVAYHSRKIWVDEERWLALREERFARSGKLLKTTRITEVFRTDGRWYPRRMVFKDALARGDGTEFIIDDIDFETEVPDYLLTKAALRK